MPCACQTNDLKWIKKEKNTISSLNKLDTCIVKYIMVLSNKHIFISFIVPLFVLSKLAMCVLASHTHNNPHLEVFKMVVVGRELILVQGGTGRLHGQGHWSRSAAEHADTVNLKYI